MPSSDIVRVATRPDFSGTSRFPAWMSRVLARRLCPDFLYKDKGVRERTLYKTHNLLLLYGLQWETLLPKYIFQSKTFFGQFALF